VVWLKAQESSAPCYGNQGAGGYQAGALNELPALNIGWKRDENGPGVERFNKKAAIDSILSRHNAEVVAFADRQLHGSCSCHLGGRGGGGAVMVLAGIALALFRRRRPTSG